MILSSPYISAVLGVIALALPMVYMVLKDYNKKLSLKSQVVFVIMSGLFCLGAVCFRALESGFYNSPLRIPSSTIILSLILITATIILNYFCVKKSHPGRKK